MDSYLCVEDPVIMCPYNRSHLISRSRIQYHIVKCEKNYPPNYKIMCPYNATHRLFKSEITQHILLCSQQMNVDVEFQNEPKRHGSLNFVLHSEITSNIDCDENWDSEVDNELNLPEIENVTKEIPSDYIQDESVESALGILSLDHAELRPPRGYSEAMMKEIDGDSIKDDQSVVSGMAIGRGRLEPKKEKRRELIGRGRGKPTQK